MNWTRSRSSSGLTDIVVNVLRQYVERHIAAEHHGVVKRLQVVLRAERLDRLLALPVDLAVADLVAARLAGPGAIAIDLARYFDGIRSVDVDEELHALFPGPAFRVNPGINYETAGAE